jgi:hypothetical protein
MQRPSRSRRSRCRSRSDGKAGPHRHPARVRVGRRCNAGSRQGVSGRTNDRDAFAPFLKRYPGEPGHSFSLLASATHLVHRDSQLSAETHFNGKTWELLDEL